MFGVRRCSVPSPSPPPVAWAPSTPHSPARKCHCPKTCQSGQSEASAKAYIGVFPLRHQRHPDVLVSPVGGVQVPVAGRGRQHIHSDGGLLLGCLAGGVLAAHECGTTHIRLHGLQAPRRLQLQRPLQRLPAGRGRPTSHIYSTRTLSSAAKQLQRVAINASNQTDKDTGSSSA